MVLSLIRKPAGTKNSRELKRMRRVVERINALEPQFEVSRFGRVQPIRPRLQVVPRP